MGHVGTEYLRATVNNAVDPKLGPEASSQRYGLSRSPGCPDKLHKIESGNLIQFKVGNRNVMVTDARFIHG